MAENQGSKDPASKEAQSVAAKAYDSAIQAASYVDQTYNVTETVKEGVETVKLTGISTAKKGILLAKDFDQQYCLSSKALSLDEQYQITTTGKRVASQAATKAQEALDAAKKRDPTGTLPVVENYMQALFTSLIEKASEVVAQAQTMLDVEGEPKTEANPAGTTAPLVKTTQEIKAQ